MTTVLETNPDISIFEKLILQGIDRGIISLTEDRSKIIYHVKEDRRFPFNNLGDKGKKNPEELVRAAYFTELVLDYQYDPKRIDIEVIVPRRTPEDRADIVIYEDSKCLTPYLVVECKKDGITDAEFRQAIEQAFGNSNSIRAKYCIVVAGNTKKAFQLEGFPPNERDKNVIADIPKKYGKAPKYRFTKGTESDLKVVSRDELITALEKCHDTVWQGGKLAPTTAFDEVSKLLFCKLRDEKTTKKNDIYEFQIGTNETPEEVYKRINGIYQEAKKIDAEVFKEEIRLEPRIVFNVVQHLQELAINKIDLDTKGIAFEKFMEDFFKGKMGQFFTPRNIINFCVKMLDPQPTHHVIDPSCGSGGFLLSAMDKIRKEAERDYDADEAKDIWHGFASKRLYGIEINDQIARVCKMNMIIHDDGHTNVISMDALEEFKTIKAHKKDFKKDFFDVLLTNPPFGAVVKSTEKDYLDNYTLGKGKKNQKTEILFIERCIDFVKPGSGKIAMVLPDGILTNSSLQYVRDLMMQRCRIDAVVSLPQFAFSHYGAGVKSSLVFMTRKADNERHEDYPIFMAIADHIGYDATGREDPINELDDILVEYRKFQKTPSAYQVFSK
jgi:type I restriction enzyme M protein